MEYKVLSFQQKYDIQMQKINLPKNGIKKHDKIRLFMYNPKSNDEISYNFNYINNDLSCIGICMRNGTILKTEINITITESDEEIKNEELFKLNDNINVFNFNNNKIFTIIDQNNNIYFKG